MFDTFRPEPGGRYAAGRASRRCLAGLDKEIKAVTYHNLRLVQTGRRIGSEDCVRCLIPF